MEKKDKPIPSSFYTGETGITPLDDSIKNILETSYAYHIERLMIIGNLILLCIFHSNQVKINFIYRDEDLIYWTNARSGFYKFKSSFYKLNNIQI